MAILDILKGLGSAMGGGSQPGGTTADPDNPGGLGGPTMAQRIMKGLGGAMSGAANANGPADKRQTVQQLLGSKRPAGKRRKKASGIPGTITPGTFPGAGGDYAQWLNNMSSGDDTSGQGAPDPELDSPEQ